MPRTYEDKLRERGDVEAVSAKHQCFNCARWTFAFALVEVKDISIWPHDYVCTRCYTNDFSRPLTVVFEQAGFGVPLSDEEVVAQRASITKRKRALLSETIWATATDGTVSEEERAVWGLYRAAVAAIDENKYSLFAGVVWPPEPE